MGSEEGADSAPSAESTASIPLDVVPLHSTTLLTVLDETGVIRYESPSIERILGFEQDDLIGERVAAYFHPDDRERVVGAFRAIVDSEGDRVESVEYRHERADGSYLWVESVGSADPTPEGHYVVNTHDISERKVREKALERTNERLDAFARVVSHDLRNPLNVATGRLALAREGCDSDHLAEVARAHERMETLIEDLLTLARAGAEVGDMVPVDIAAVGEACWRTVATDEATLVMDIDRTVRADESRLRQLLENLIRNAVDHGGTAPTITIGETDDEAGFFVEDDGPGIPADRRERTFVSGYSTKSDGTGLGLAIVAEIVSAHGWEIEVTEGDHGGARFEITGVRFR